MFPYRDENHTLRTPVVTLVLIAANVATWILVQGAGSPLALASSVCDLGLIPAELTMMAKPGSGFPMGEGLACLTDPGRQPLNVVSSMFLHGSWAHLLGNMWFLWIFGNNVEDSMGRGRFVVFYVVSGLAAALLQVFMNPGSLIPMVGASGAISGVMGGYVLLYPFTRVYVIVPLGILTRSMVMPAWTMVGYWALLQIVSGVVALGGPETGGVAFWAHIGGFVAGLALIHLFARRDYVEAHRAHPWAPRRLGWR